MTAYFAPPRYLPDLDYLHRLYHADVFVMLDTDKPQDCDRRAPVLARGARQELSVPLVGRYRKAVKDEQLDEARFLDSHLNKVQVWYGQHRYYRKADAEVLFNWPAGALSALLESSNNYRVFVQSMLFSAYRLLDLHPRFVAHSYAAFDTVCHNDYTAIAHRLGCERVSMSAEMVQDGRPLPGFAKKAVGGRPFYCAGVDKPYAQAKTDGYQTGLSFIDSLFTQGAQATADLITKPPVEHTFDL